MLPDVLRSIQPVDRQAYQACQDQFDQIAKPIASLGELEVLLARICAITGSAQIDLGRKCVLTFCADNGVVRRGVAQSDHQTTTIIAGMLASGRACVCSMARAAGADVFPVDIGMVDTVAGLLPRKVAAGTEDMTQGPAMTAEQAWQAIQTGIELVGQRRAEGYRLIATGEAGIGNTTTSSAMAAVLLGCPAEEVTGRGAGLSDAGLVRKIEAILQALACNQPKADDPFDVLCKVGGLDIAAMTGAFIGGAVYRVPVLIDGLISSIAALTAVRMQPLIADYLIPSHISSEPAGARIMQALNLAPLLHAQMRLGEGTGAVALFPILDQAAAVYNSGVTFASIALDSYRRQP